MLTPREAPINEKSHGSASLGGNPCALAVWWAEEAVAVRYPPVPRRVAVDLVNSS